MGRAVLETAKIPCTLKSDRALDTPVEIDGETYRVNCVNMGNPHAVMFVRDPEVVDLPTIGPMIEHHPLFPRRTNVEFVRVIDRGILQMRVWERGTGETIGCGTGCCTAAVAAALLGYCDRKVTVEQIGGNLLVDWREEDGHVRMTGPSYTVFEGVLLDEG